MFMFDTQKLHSFIFNYIIIIAQNQLKCKSYVLGIKASQVKRHIIYIKMKYIFFMPFLHFQAYKFCVDILFYDFHTDSIEIS
jgi:hypothetical protein